uniref:WD repeat domain 27 n=1 Tax=Fundulus heteroclitus TaxID=8078 RepID=A0A3Q2P1J0_FUNHE
TPGHISLSCTARPKFPFILLKISPDSSSSHHDDISAMAFGKRSNPVILCSASSDYIILWDVEACKLAAGMVIGTLLGNVVHLSFCFSDERVAACSGTTLYVLSSKRQEVICTLKGHLGPLTSAEFCTWNPNVLVSTSEDRTFKVWDLKTGAVFYQSFVLSGKIHFCDNQRKFIVCNQSCLIVCVSTKMYFFLPKAGIKEKPLVFHSKVKSSGYTTTPRYGKVYHPALTIFSCITYLLCCLDILSKHSSRQKSLCLEIAILCGLGDRSVLLYNSCLTGSPTAYVGHDKPVSSVNWSLCRQWWLSAAEDLSLRIWTNSSSEPAIIMGDTMFSKPIRGAQFYYLDKFILLTSGPSVHLYLYNVDLTRDDIKRYKQRSFIKLTSCLTPSVSDITALSGVNDFLSYIVLVCCSDRSIQVLDMNKGTVGSVVPDAHSRAIHCITQNKGSTFTSQALESYNLFLTSAVTDGVKLWDLRTMRCVRRYENHVNRCHPCSLAISPCGRFIASGSEDKCAYLYDIRSSTYLHKLQRHSDTVLTVAFNPATPEVSISFLNI